VSILFIGTPFPSRIDLVVQTVAHVTGAQSRPQRLFTASLLQFNVDGCAILHSREDRTDASSSFGAADTGGRNERPERGLIV
jgi:hypothetical protein